MIRRLALFALLAGLLAGCAGRLTYTGPAVPAAQAGSVLLPYGLQAGWAHALQALERHGYRILQADPATASITLQVAGLPQQYVDCGDVQSMVATGRDKIVRTYTFPAAAGQQTYEQLMRGNIYDVNRRMALLSTVQVHLDAVGKAQTRASVQVEYKLTRTVQIRNATQRDYPAITDTIAFTSKAQGRFPGFDKATRCVATGQLEREILNALQSGGQPQAAR
ncbi:hypothetical protein [Castellaniella sp.]|uniref:hypothetical protein n=1 Tax=Castellaniella sp. TaxID=1955812 RepID=UPI00355DD87C